MAVVFYDHKTSEKEILYTGAVLDRREESGYDDSDFYAVVYDTAEKKMKRIDYASTRYAGGGSCSVDATEDIRQLAKLDAYNRILKTITEHPDIRKGVNIRVIKGRKIPLGTEGEVVDIFTVRRFGKPVYTQITCRDIKGNWFKTYEQNIKVIQTQEEIERKAEFYADQIYRNDNWGVFFSTMEIYL